MAKAKDEVSIIKIILDRQEANTKRLDRVYYFLLVSLAMQAAGLVQGDPSTAAELFAFIHTFFTAS